jgi:hypothetical protein
MLPDGCGYKNVAKDLSIIALRCRAKPPVPDNVELNVAGLEPGEISVRKNADSDMRKCDAP